MPLWRGNRKVRGVKSACIIHSYVHKQKGINCMPLGMTEENEMIEVPSNISRHLEIHDAYSVVTARNYLANYSLSSRASLL